MVTTHATTIFRNTAQSTVLLRLVVPTPATAPATVWVVETGAPSAVEPKSAIAAPVSAQKPLTGRSRVMPVPIVRTMRHPPDSVPSAMNR